MTVFNALLHDLRTYFSREGEVGRFSFVFIVILAYGLSTALGYFLHGEEMRAFAEALIKDAQTPDTEAEYLRLAFPVRLDLALPWLLTMPAAIKRLRHLDWPVWGLAVIYGVTVMDLLVPTAVFEAVPLMALVLGVWALLSTGATAALMVWPGNRPISPPTAGDEEDN